MPFDSTGMREDNRKKPETTNMVQIAYPSATKDACAVMTQWSVKDKGLYYRPNTDHNFPKYRPNTDQFFQYFPKIQIIKIFVSIL